MFKSLIPCSPVEHGSYRSWEWSRGKDARLFMKKWCGSLESIHCTHSFLAGLLDALASGVKGSFFTLGRILHVFPGLGIWRRSVHVGSDVWGQKEDKPLFCFSLKASSSSSSSFLSFLAAFKGLTLPPAKLTLTGENSYTGNNEFCTFSACATHCIYAISEGTDSKG